MQYVEEFSEAISNWKDAYVCAIQSYVGLKTSQGERVLLYGRTVLEPSMFGIDQKAFSFETKNVFAGRFLKTLKLGEVSILIEKAQVGQMIDGPALRPKKSSDPFNLYSTSDYHPLVSNLRIGAESRQFLQRQAKYPQYLNWEMKSADVPFDTLDDLTGYCGLPAWDVMRDETRLEIVANAPGRIDKRSVITEGNGIIVCRVAKTLDVSKLKIGVRVFAKDHEVIRASIKGNLFEWHDENDYLVGKCSIQVGDAPVLEAYLSYAEVPIDQSSVSDPTKHLNPRHAINQLFDPKNDRLPLLLSNPGGDREKSFEGGVSTLLTLLGFSVSNYGRIPKFQEGPDIIAMTPSGHVAIVECTVGLLNQNDKISKLVHRSRAIREKLANSGYSGVEIQPVGVTLLSQEEVAADLDDARAHGIAVICKQNLEDALKQIELPLDADRFFRNLKKLIPAPKNQSPFGNSIVYQ
jgi:hypothetical protein